MADYGLTDSRRDTTKREAAVVGRVFVWTRRFTCLAVVLVVATSCIRLDMAMTVDRDGTGTVEFQVMLSEIFIEIAEAFSEDDASGDICAEMLDESGLMTDVPVGAEVREFLEGGWCGIEMVLPFTDFDISELSEDGDIQLWVNEQTVFFHFDVSELTADSGDEMSFEEMAVMAKLFDLELDEPKVNFEVVLPGSPVEHNADSVRGSTFSWELDLMEGDKRTSLHASADMSDPQSAGSGSSSLLWLLLIGGGCLGLAGIATFAMRRQSDTTTQGGDPS
ncbi:MAG: hypothetical protein VYC56_05350 [Actinomycetota bacterium]|nr:hypothetical protein [Actinomycetota bacterium]MEC9394661.1 hypothetical protein [Actinomycetota bacterium]MEC9467806.1 hypothetical protein [Actinomycetota bacterium]